MKKQNKFILVIFFIIYISLLLRVLYFGTIYRNDISYIRLYKNNKKVDNYFSIIKYLKYHNNFIPNNLVLVFTKTFFEIKKHLGGDGASLIYLTVDNKVLRINIHDKRLDAFDVYYNIYNNLKYHNIDVAYTETSKYNEEEDDEEIEYLLHEKIEIQFNLLNFLKKKDKNFNKIYDDFIKFMGNLNDYIYIEDLHPNNIIYTIDKKWMAIDFGTVGKEIVHFKFSDNIIEEIKKLDNLSEENVLTKVLEFYSKEDLQHHIYTNYNCPLNNCKLDESLINDINNEIIYRRITKLIQMIS